MKYSQILFFFFVFFLSIINPLSASDVSISLKLECGEVYFSIFNNSTQKNVFLPFKRSDPILILVFYQNGTLIRDSFWREIPLKREPEIGTHRPTSMVVQPLEKPGPFSVGFVNLHGRFQLKEPGKYFICCFLKKGRKVSEGLWPSNIIVANVKDERIIDGETISKENLPAGISSAFKEEIDKLLMEN